MAELREDYLVRGMRYHDAKLVTIEKFRRIEYGKKKYDEEYAA